jgi:hypothetical protein
MSEAPANPCGANEGGEVKGRLAILTATLCAAAVGAAPALGAKEPVPGEPNCHGQFIAFLAQLGKTSGEQRARGLGQLAKFFSEFGEPTTVQDLQRLAREFCALGP